MMSDRDLYESDFVRWADEQAAELRRRANGADAAIDWLNVAEEIETLARADRRESRDQLVVLCANLLKGRFRPDVRLRIAILEARDKIAELIEESPSLAPYPAAQLAWAYVRGRREAETDTGLLDLPPECPWAVDQVINHDFWPP
jgi:Domain of unknown function DUF29